MVYSLSFCEAITFLARAHADVRLCAYLCLLCWLWVSTVIPLKRSLTMVDQL
jgi:uncharacterized Fe-S cluster-containing radical SAM superfamily protein